MILVTITINAVDYQVSTRQLALETPWNDDLLEATGVGYQLRQKFGGYAAPVFGEVKLKPSLFTEANWPPPVSCAVTIEYTTTTEAAAEELFKGSAHLKNFSRTDVVYELYTDEYDTYIAESTAISDTLNAVFTTYCGASYLNLTLNTTNARASSPNVVYTVGSKTPTLDVLSDIAAFFTHCFYIRGTTLYLVDMLLNNGTTTLTEFDFYPSSYANPQPYATFWADPGQVDGSYSYGEELSVSPICHDTEANIETELANIKTILERKTCVLEKDLATSDLPVPGMKISFTDESTVYDVDVEMWARNLTFDFTTEDVIIEGDCTVT